MSKFFILFLLIYFLNFSLKAQNSSSPFLKEYHSFKIDTNVDVAVLYMNNFYCLRSDSQVFLIDAQKNKVDLSYQDNSKKIGLLNLYLSNDTIIGLSKYDTYYLNVENRQWHLLKKGVLIPPIYEDDDYVVTSVCHGEFGGWLNFKSKKTNKSYTCACQCAINISKNDNKYLVTASLSHMTGFTNIFEINAPLKLKRLSTSSSKRVSSDKGTTQIIDTIGVTCASNFKLNKRNYFLIEKYKKVFIDVISNEKLVPIDNLTSLNIWSDYPTTRTCGETQVSCFSNSENTGLISINNNKLTIYSFRLKNN